jgi:hypothetical protein
MNKQLLCLGLVFILGELEKNYRYIYSTMSNHDMIETTQPVVQAVMEISQHMVLDCHENY